MKNFILIIMFLLFNTVADAKIYKWTDENGSIHFSDTPSSEAAEEVKVKSTGITLHKSDEELAQEKLEAQEKKNLPTKRVESKSPTTKQKPKEEKVITEEDYKIISNASKLGADAISISGRISSGPKCKEMSVTATASNENGLRITITDQVRKNSAHGSTVFGGTAGASGSAEDRSFWKVDSVVIRCNDK